MKNKKVIRLTESDLVKIVKKVLSEDKKGFLNEAVNVGGVTVDIDKKDPNKLIFDGCKYKVEAKIAGISVNPGYFRELRDLGNKVNVEFDDKSNNVDKGFLQNNIGKFKGCPQVVNLTYEIDWSPDVYLTFRKA